ncbi:hypothetical protein BJS_08536 [Bradyrhizobium japonicum SEMIA 5079]|nr:hypothetical protein BJS_08536 [Bradyrhizobium japonicum SEMIA 5079]
MDPARLHGFRHLADELDDQQSVAEGSLLHLNIVGEIEHAPERTRGDALVQVLAGRFLGLLPSIVSAFCSAVTAMSSAPKPATASEIR